MKARRCDLVVTRQGARFLGRRFPVAIGRGGFTGNKREGDGATPVGVWRLMTGFYRADRVTAPDGPLDMRAVGPLDLWSDDPDDNAYNHAVRAPYGPSHERLRRGDGLYDIVLVSDWNWPDAVPGRGSAIFVHCWRGPRKPTAGCLAFRPDHLRWILARWTPRSRVVVRGQGPQS
ncbi:L,D-transpeptidase family protein [Maritimibacter sp. DP07]|uniref:L,D-transpeptidase family protein n=1 Tax=Maritimibacter harenae TaxID=2606218 RepID=A0A845M7K4_9RHOB|nr:L,D-transpeptidase family protein [Maritimibacter harenae]MZR15109.1 L,D-transpeptidase family protein [Maritimibacter harenae]